MTDGMSENAREVREARGHVAAATPADAERWPSLFGNGAKRERDALGVPEDETEREKVQRLCTEHRLAQVRADLLHKLASVQVEHSHTTTQLKLRCTNLEAANEVLKSELAMLRTGAARSQAMDKIPRMEPALREQAAALRNLRPSTTTDIRTSPPAAAAAAAPPPEDEEELDPADEEAIHAAELRARDEANALRVRDNLVPSPPPLEEDEDDGNYDVEPATAPAVPGYDESNPADRKMRQLVLQGKLRVEQRWTYGRGDGAQREVVLPGDVGSRSDVFENKETFKLLTHRFYFDSTSKLWGRVPVQAQ